MFQFSVVRKLASNKKNLKIKTRINWSARIIFLKNLSWFLYFICILLFCHASHSWVFKLHLRGSGISIFSFPTSLVYMKKAGVNKGWQKSVRSALSQNIARVKRFRR